MDATVKWFPKVLSPGNYALAFQTLEVPLTGLNSLIVTLLCTLGHVVACAFIGYGLGRYSYGFTKWIFAFVVLSIIIPAQNLIIPRYIIYSSMEQLLNVKILDTYLPLIVPGLFRLRPQRRPVHLPVPPILPPLSKIHRGSGPYRRGGPGRHLLPHRPAHGGIHHPGLPGAVHRLALERLLRTLHFPHHPEKMAAAPGAARYVRPPDRQLDGDLTASAEATKYHAGVVMAGTVISVLPLLILYFLLQRWFMEGVERSGLVE